MDLGGSIHESEDRNGAAVEQILKVAGSNIVELVLSTSLPAPVDSDSTTGTGTGTTSHFGNLQVLRIAPHFPMEYLEETLGHFSGSPIHTISYECFDMDAVEVCQALEIFLSVRVCRGGDAVASTVAASYKGEGEGEGEGNDARGKSYYYDCLRKVEVAVVVQSAEWEGVSELWKKKQEEMQCVGVMKLVRYCRDLGLVGVVFRRRRVRRAIPGPYEHEQEEEEEWDLEEEDETCCWDVSEPGTDAEVLQL